MLAGGRLRNLARFDLRGSWIPLAMLVVQLGFIIYPLGEGLVFTRAGPWISMGSYALLIVFLMVNRALPGVKMILLGAVLNLVVITANGGYMPVTPEALERSGHLDRVTVQGEAAFVRGSKDIVLSEEETRLAPLSDLISTPAWSPVAATMSAGDVFIMLGAAWLAYRALQGDPVCAPGLDDQPASLKPQASTEVNNIAPNSVMGG
jgi:hypothetical protein